MAKKLHLVHVKSNVVNKLPSANVINYGEIAVNYNANSPALAIKDSNDNIVKFAPQSYVDSNFVYDAEYYSSGSTHEIRLYDASRNVLATIDADDFIKDGMVHDVYITGDTMVITFNTDAGHEDIELDITDIFDPDIYYTKSEVDEKTVVDSALDTGSTHPVQNKVVYQYILDNELVAAAALNDLNDRKADKDYVDEAVSAASITVDSTIDSASTNPVENRIIYQALEDSKVTVDSTLSTASTNPVQNKVVYQYILDNELAIAASLNDLNDRKADKSYVDAAVTSVTIDVDSVLDSASTNPVENRVIYNALNNVSIDVDDHLDSASTNPVQNKVLWKVIADDEKVTSAALNNLNDNKADKSYVDAAITGVTIDVDDQLDSASTNPVENRVVYDAINNITIDVDDQLDSASTNPVENRVIYQALQNVGVTVDSVMDSASTNPVQNKVVYQYILDNELVAAAAINSLNDRKSDKSYVNSNFVNDVEYYSSGSTHEIRFKDVSGNTIATVNANDFIKDGMVHDVYLTGSTMVITFNTDAGQEDIELDITDIFDPDLYYTKDEIDGTLSGYTTTSDLTTLLAGKQPLIDSQHKLDYSLLDNTPTIPTVESMTAQEVSTAVASAWTTVFGS